jgi:hypothetical protein
MTCGALARRAVTGDRLPAQRQPRARIRAGDPGGRVTVAPGVYRTGDLASHAMPRTPAPAQLHLGSAWAHTRGPGSPPAPPHWMESGFVAMTTATPARSQWLRPAAESPGFGRVGNAERPFTRGPGLSPRALAWARATPPANPAAGSAVVVTAGSTPAARRPTTSFGLIAGVAVGQSDRVTRDRVTSLKTSATVTGPTSAAGRTGRPAGSAARPRRACARLRPDSRLCPGQHGLRGRREFHLPAPIAVSSPCHGRVPVSCAPVFAGARSDPIPRVGR